MNTLLEFSRHALQESAALFTAMAPFLLLGFAANALVALLVPERWITRHLGQPGFRGVLMATLLGIPLPLCSCSVLPMAMGLRARGASIGSTIAFLIATPQTGVDSILVTGQMLGWPFAIFKVIAALFTGLLAGTLAEWLVGNKAPAPAAAEPMPAQDPHGHAHAHPGPAPADAAAEPWSKRIRAALTIGLFDFPESLGGVLLLGIFIGGALAALIPPNALASTDPANRFLSMLAILVMAVPMYVCSTGSVPIAVEFHNAGVAQGALLIFLMAGPATNIAEISVIRKRLGTRALLIFLAVIVGASIGLGYAFDGAKGLLEFGAPNPALSAEHAGHAHHLAAADASAPAAAGAGAALGSGPTTLLDWLSVATLALLLLFPPLRKIVKQWRRTPQEDPAMAADKEDLQTYEFNLAGLNCEHCIRTAKNSLQGLPGLESLTLNLHKAVLKGKDLNVDEVVARIQKQGYEAHLAQPQ